MSDPLIQLIGITRRDATTNRSLLDGVDFSIQTGDRIGLSGPSGSGKSTLLRAIARLDPCDGGKVLWRGDAVGKDAVPAYRRCVIYLSQRPAFVAGTVRENLELPFRLGAATQPFDLSLVMRWMDQLKKPRTFLELDAKTLSGGEQQIIALLRAISLNPHVLLLDEPTASLDPEATMLFEQLADAWFDAAPQGDGADSGRSADHAWVWTSHDLDQVSRMSARRVEMRDGVLTSGDEDE